MLEVNLIPTLKKLFDIQFIKKSFYNFLPTDKPYSDFLAINYDNDFFTLSNGNVFVILLLQTDKKIVEKIKEKLNFIFNREKYIVSFEKSEFENVLDKITYIKLDDLIEHSVKNGTCENNFYNLKLQEVFGDKTYAQQRV